MDQVTDAALVDHRWSHGGLFTLGEALAVFLPCDDAPLESSSIYRRTVAGSETNVAAAVTRLGLPACLVTIVGKDALGDAVKQTLTMWGIDARVNRSDRTTGVLIRDLFAHSSGRSVNLRKASAATDLSPAHVDQVWSGEADAVFVTGITAVRSPSALAAVQHTVKLARSTGAFVVVDPNFRPSLGGVDQFSSALASIRGQVDVAIGDEGELALLSGTSPRDAVSALLDQGCTWVVTKLGAAGAIATNEAVQHRVESRATTVIDTVGAGDAFAAGVIVGLIEGKPMTDALELASAVAACVVGTAGDIEGLPYRHEICSEGASK
ncbi:MAG: sugar kinase [Salinibacterium sp.]|nr:sugar kinase [Salinibacterium sp.]